MKSYTDIEQSCKLVEILPLESADMRYGYIAPYEFSDRMYDGGYDKVPYPKDFLKLCADFCEEDLYDGSLRCWSLSALLEYLREIDLFPNIIDSGDLVLMDISFYDDEEGKVLHPIHSLRVEGKTILDACVEMIVKLHEQKVL